MLANEYIECQRMNILSANEYIECQRMNILSVSEWIYWVSACEYIECQQMNILSVSEWIHWVSANEFTTQLTDSTKFVKVGTVWLSLFTSPKDFNLLATEF